MTDRRPPADLEELRARLSALEDPLTLLAGIFAFAPFGIQIYEPTGRSVLTNRAFREMFGSEPPPGYNVLSDEIAKAAGVLGLIHRAFAGETVYVPAVWYDPRDLKQVKVEVGRRVAIESTFFPLLDPTGRVSHVAIVFKDLTAELSAREETERERDLLRRLIGILAHDLRTPLTAVLGTASALLGGRADPQRLRSGLLRIHQSAGRMDRMIANILDLTRIRVTGELPVSRGDVDLAGLCRTVLDELRIAHPGRELSLSISGNVTGRWDADRITQVLVNLMTNALTFGHPSSPVRVGVTERGAEVALTVHNEGPAILEDDLPAIFEPFRRGTLSARAETSPGTGLGLFIAHQIVVAHGGRIGVTSSAEEGTTFEVVLPRASADATGSQH